MPPIGSILKLRVKAEAGNTIRRQLLFKIYKWFEIDDLQK